MAETDFRGDGRDKAEIVTKETTPTVVTVASASESTPVLKARVQALKRRVEELTTENANSRRGKDLALKDWLLGLPNRRAFEERLREEWARTRRSGRTFAVAMIDIDGLKHINDEHGHAAGDKALLFASRILRGKLRQIDFLARWGGDEFAVILPEANLSSAEDAVGRIQTLLDERSSAMQAHPSGAEPAVSFSFGVAVDQASTGEAALMLLADAAMYRSKTRRTHHRGEDGMSTKRAASRARRNLQGRKLEGGPEGPTRVLLAEDDHELRRLLAAELGKAGYEVYEADTGFELLKQLGDLTLRNLAIDLIVTDIRMPGQTGLSIVEGLRNGSKPGSWRTPVMLMTAFGDEETHAEAKRLGAVIFDKPFDLDDFRACAMNMVGPVSA